MVEEHFLIDQKSPIFYDTNRTRSVQRPLTPGATTPKTCVRRCDHTFLEKMKSHRHLLFIPNVKKYLEAQRCTPKLHKQDEIVQQALSGNIKDPVFFQYCWLQTCLVKERRSSSGLPAGGEGVFRSFRCKSTALKCKIPPVVLFKTLTKKKYRLSVLLISDVFRWLGWKMSLVCFCSVTTTYLHELRNVADFFFVMMRFPVKPGGFLETSPHIKELPTLHINTTGDARFDLDRTQT